MSREHQTTELLVLAGADVERLLTMAQCIGLMERTMRVVSSGGAQLPLRIGAAIPGGNVLAAMPGYLEQPASAGAKIIAVYPENARRGLSSHLGVVVLFDPARGVPVAILDATSITALRTAAASAVATNALARSDAGELAILGAGEQAATHLTAMAHVRKLRSVCIWARRPEKAQAFAREHAGSVDVPIRIATTVEEAVRDADLVCTTTGAREPILEGAWIRAGTHVNLVGASSAQTREANEALVMKAAYFCDFRPSALAQAGELIAAAGALAERHIRGEIGEVLNGKVRGRSNADEVTIYKSLGIAAQDLAAAHHVYVEAQREGCGTRVRL